MLGLTQWQLAELMGTSNKQIHKYETGVNRITVGRLYQSAQALAVEIGYFFDGLAGERAVRSTPQQRLLLELIRKFAAIPDERLRGALCDLVRALALSRPRA